MTDDAAAAYARSIMDDAAQIRVTELFGRSADSVVHRSPVRHGIAAVVARTSELREDELLEILRFRTAQYLAVGMIDPRMVHAAGLRHDPIESVKPGDVHVVVGSAEGGEIYSSIWARCMPAAPPGSTLRTLRRPMIGKEDIFGRDVFNHLRILPDLPIAKIRDVGRFVKNQRLAPFSEASVRAPMEAVVALLHAILGPLRPEIEAIVGDVEDGISDRHLDYFHFPTVVVRGVLPCAPEDAWLHRRYLERCCYPYAALMIDADAVERRLAEVEAALELPGTEAARRLVALGQSAGQSPSSLEPEEPRSRLMSVALPQVGVPMEERRKMIAAGDRLRALFVFASLSGPEATTLGRLMSREELPEGAMLFSADADGELLVIDEGTAHAWVRDREGGTSLPREIGPGQIAGQIALVTGGGCFEEARARSPMVVRRLPGETYRRLLADRVEIDRAIAREAAMALTASRQRG